MAARTVAELPIAIPQDALRTFCERHHIRWLALFGSVLRDDFGPESDIDVLVEFEQGHVPGWEFFAMEDELASVLGRKVDLHTVAGLNRWVRGSVLASAHVLHGA
jgi:predicted nucleotidyltransferase